VAEERLFVALDLPEAVCERLRATVSALKQQAPEARFVASEGWHITLKFIGETTRRAEIVEQLRAIRRNSFDFAMRGLGFFPTPQTPRIFWSGIEQPLGQTALQELASEIDRKLAAIGIAAAAKAFKPHMTLARSGSGDPHEKFTTGDAGLMQIARIIHDQPQPFFGDARAEEFILYRSQLLPRGAKYTALERFALR